MQQDKIEYQKSFEKLIVSNQEVTENYCGKVRDQIQSLLDANQQQFHQIEQLQSIQAIQQHRYAEIQGLQTKKDSVQREAYVVLRQIVELLEQCQELGRSLQESQQLSQQITLMQTYIQLHQRLSDLHKYSELKFFKTASADLDIQVKATLQRVCDLFEKKLDFCCRQTSQPIAEQLPKIISEIKEMQPIILLSQKFDASLFSKMRRTVTKGINLYCAGRLRGRLPAVLTPQSVDIADFQQIFKCLRSQKLAFQHYQLVDGSKYQGVDNQQYKAFGLLFFELLYANVLLTSSLADLFPLTPSKISCINPQQYGNFESSTVANTMMEFLGQVFSFLSSPTDICSFVTQGKNQLINQTLQSLLKNRTLYQQEHSEFITYLSNQTKQNPILAFYLLGIFTNFQNLLPGDLGGNLSQGFLVFELYNQSISTFLSQQIILFTQQQILTIKQQKCGIYQTGISIITLNIACFIQDLYLTYLKGYQQISLFSQYSAFQEYQKHISEALGGKKTQYLVPCYETDVSQLNQALELPNTLQKAIKDISLQFVDQMSVIAKADRQNAEKYSEIFQLINCKFFWLALTPLFQKQVFAAVNDKITQQLSQLALQYTQQQLLHQMVWENFMLLLNQTLDQGFPSSVIPTKQGLFKQDVDKVIQQVYKNQKDCSVNLFKRIMKQANFQQQPFANYSKQAQTEFFTATYEYIKSKVVDNTCAQYSLFVQLLKQCYGSDLEQFPPDVSQIRQQLVVALQVCK